MAEQPGRDGTERCRGLAIVERVCDEVTAAAVPDGTLVRLRLRF